MRRILHQATEPPWAALVACLICVGTVLAWTGMLNVRDQHPSQAVTATDDGALLRLRLEIIARKIDRLANVNRADRHRRNAP